MSFPFTLQKFICSQCGTENTAPVDSYTRLAVLKTVDVGAETFSVISAPRGFTTVITGGSIAQTSGTARNFQLVTQERNRQGTVYPLSANDSSVKILRGELVLFEDDILYAVVAAGPDVMSLAGWLSMKIRPTTGRGNVGF